MKTFHVDGLAATLKVICGNGHTHSKKKVMALKRRNPPDGPEHESDQTSTALKGLGAWDRLSKPRIEMVEDLLILRPSLRPLGLC